MEKRAFRTPDSIQAERFTRPMVGPLLLSKGYTNVTDSYDPAKRSQGQTIQAIDPNGHSVHIRVKLCWRPRPRSAGREPFFAAQLFAKIKNGDWDGSIKSYVETARTHSITHFLFVVREGNEITHAALVPLGELASIWYSQRDISNQLIKGGKLGRRKKNHAMNGSSPTLWLQDGMAPEVADGLWKHRGVQDVVLMKVVGGRLSSQTFVNDTFDDLPGFDLTLLGSDGAPRVPILRSMVKRDQRVRGEVLRRANGKCERSSCGITRSYPGFFDVHHILGADKSDRVYNSVALCPNCHREAHSAPNHCEINDELLDFAMRFKPKQPRT